MSNEWITLTRTGDTPLRFQGSLVAEASGEFINPPKDRGNPDFYVIRIFRCDAPSGTTGVFVVEIVYAKSFRGETRHHTVKLTTQPAQVIRAYDPLATLINFPPDVVDREARQRALENKSRRQYEAVATQALQDFPETLGHNQLAECECELLREMLDRAIANRQFGLQFDSPGEDGNACKSDAWRTQLREVSEDGSDHSQFEVGLLIDDESCCFLAGVDAELVA